MTPDPSDPTRASQDRLDALGSLAEPTRRALYEAVASSPEPLDRDAAAQAVGVSRELAAFHLDRLVRAGLLEPTYRRRSGRSGPGAGRPAKFYRRPPGTIELSLPPRSYELAARLFAVGLEHADDAARSAAAQAARATGGAIASAIEGTPAAGSGAPGGAAGPGRAGEAGGTDDDTHGLLEALRARGFEPVEDPEGSTIRLRNCPFDALVADHRSVICPLNLALLDGLANALGSELRPVPADEPGYCCVAFRRTA